MDAHTGAMLGVAAFGVASALLLVAVVVLRLRADGGEVEVSQQTVIDSGPLQR